MAEANLGLSEKLNPVVAESPIVKTYDSLTTLGPNVASSCVAWGMDNGHVLCHLAKFGKGMNVYRLEDDVYRMIGTNCRNIEKCLLPTGLEITANVSVVKLLDGHQVENCLIYNSSDSHLMSYRLKTFPEELQSGTNVMLLNHCGIKKFGHVASSFSGRESNLLGVTLIKSFNTETPFSSPHDLGRLVTSLPEIGSGCLKVYGMITRTNSDCLQYTPIVPLDAIDKHLCKLLADSGYKSCQEA